MILFLKKIKPLILIILLTNCNNYKSSKFIPIAVKGVLDLAGWDLKTDGTINLKGEWEFYWSKHIVPDKNKNDIIPKTIYYAEIPNSWMSIKINNKNLPSYGYCSYRLKIKNIDTNTPISIKIGEICAAYTLYINGEKIITVGKPGKSKTTTTPQYYIGSFDLGKPEKDLEIIINVSNYQYFSGGIPYYINLGTTKNIQNNEKLSNMIHNLIIGCLLIIIFLFLILFFLRKEEKTNLYFSLLCINTLCMLIFYIHSETANFFASFLNWGIILYLQLLPHYFFIITLCFYLYSLFQKDFNKKLLKSTITIYLILLSILILQFLTTSRSFSFFIGVFVFTNYIVLYIYLIYILIKALIKKRQNAGLILAVVIAIFLAHINDALLLLLIPNIAIIFPYVLIIFIIIQFYLLSHRYTKSFTDIKQLSYELEETNLQLKDININLEKKVEERTDQLKEAHKQKTNIFINIAHETKTPLTLISNYLDKYIKKHNKSDELAIIKNNFDKLKKDMINFLDIQKLERGQIFYNHDQIINLSYILKEKIKLFAEIAWKHNIKIITNNINKNFYIKIDPYAIDRVINNLIDNAIKYNKKNGIIKISLSGENDNILLIVKDTGIGISKELQENIFNPYFQISHEKRNIQGIGMGLNIVKNIIKEVNGKIEITSKINEGTAFKISFKKHKIKKDKIIIDNIKLSKPFNSLANIKLKEEKYDNNKKNILLVEDNIVMLDYLQDNFYERYNVFTAINGVRAIKKINEIPKPNIIISDIMMDKMNGYEFYDELIKNDEYNDIPFIFLTALTSNNEKIKGLQKGAVDYIYKPFTIEELENKINSLLKIQENQKRSNVLKINDEFTKVLYEENDENEENNYNLNDIIIDNKINEKEINIINFIIKGFEYKKIAAMLNINLNTVKKSIQRIYKKLDVTNKVELINKINKSPTYYSQE